MMNLTEKAAYIQGLAEGLDLPDSKEGRILRELLALVTEMADELRELDENVSELGEEMNGLADELGDIADELEGEEDEDDLYEITCPECGEKLFLDYDELMEAPSVSCPACGAEIPIEIPDCTADCENCDGCGPAEKE